jgi:hypothetical protein
VVRLFLSVGRESPISSIGFRSTISRFESSSPSQPVRDMEILPSVMLKMPANGGLLHIGVRSPGSKFGHFQGKIADSLRRIFEIFPFLGDDDWRLGQICTAWPPRRSYSSMSLGPKGNRESPCLHCRTDASVRLHQGRPAGCIKGDRALDREFWRAGAMPQRVPHPKGGVPRMESIGGRGKQHSYLLDPR